MTRTRWEYLTVRMYAYAEHKTRGESETYLEYRAKYVLCRPGVATKDAETLYEGLRRSSKFDLHALLNDLGGEGWELVADYATRSGINTHYVGWATTSEPLDRRLVFKRPAE